MEKKNLGAVAFIPLLVFLGAYIGCGIVFSVMGAESPFGYFPRHVALLAGIAAALLLAPGVKISDKVDILTENMGRSGVMMIVLIYLMASGFQGAAAAIGGKTSVINLCLHYIPVKLLVPGVFMMCCFISTAIGTSMGTMAAMAPVALGVAEGAGLNPAIVCAAVIGGSYFGDNLSMISDTTIAAVEGCGSKMRDKFRMNFFIALPAAILSLIFYAFVGGAGSGSIEVGAFDLFQIASKRLASLVDIFACAFLAVMPHDGGMLMTSEMAKISPFSILPYSVYPLFLIIATCVTIQTGLLRTAEEK